MSDEAGSSESDVEPASTPAAVPARWFAKLKIMASSVGLLVQLTGSFVAAAFDGWLRKRSFFVRKLKEFHNACSLVLPSLKFSFLSVTDSLTHPDRPASREDPIGTCEVRTKWFPRRTREQDADAESRPEESVHVEVLHDPSPGPIRADVIFIHGLHGSLFNTWKQGLWTHRKQVRNTPLKHKYELGDAAETGERGEFPGEKQPKVEGRYRCDDRRPADHNYDQLLENITDLINNIDDKIKESKNGGVPSDSKSEPYSSCWPRDWLPKDCPGVRVIAVNYTTDPFLWRPVWISKRIRSSMTQRSQQMEDILLEMNVGRYPIVWVGHSKGGLFVKQMLVDARNSEQPRLFALLQQTKGIMFYSVPHRGSSLAHWNLPFLRQSVELTEVKKDCQEVLDLHRKFMKLFEEKSLKAEVFSFVETILTFMWVTNVRVVSVDSADLGFGMFQGVNIDHREICKPLNRECFLYKELTRLIERVV